MKGAGLFTLIVLLVAFPPGKHNLWYNLLALMSELTHCIIKWEINPGSGENNECMAITERPLAITALLVMTVRYPESQF